LLVLGVHAGAVFDIYLLAARWAEWKAGEFERSFFASLFCAGVASFFAFLTPLRLRRIASAHEGPAELYFGLVGGTLALQFSNGILAHRLAYGWHTKEVRVELPTAWMGALCAFGSRGDYFCGARWPDEGRLGKLLAPARGVRALVLTVADGRAVFVLRSSHGNPDIERLSARLQEFLELMPSSAAADPGLVDHVRGVRRRMWRTVATDHAAPTSRKHESRLLQWAGVAVSQRIGRRAAARAGWLHTIPRSLATAERHEA
jgi:hypothetical protein